MDILITGAGRYGKANVRPQTPAGVNWIAKHMDLRGNRVSKGVVIDSECADDLMATITEAGLTVERE